uniref:Uncharacterized protein n=1 Tax=Hordeum vulgare subsp. vulgare TaxID=112509 RepID=M0YYE5_HORVV
MATAWDIASVGWSMIVLGWLVSPIITFLLPKIISYLGFEFHTSEKLLDLEFHIIPELEKTLRAVDQERMLGRGKKVPGVVASLDKLAAMMRHAREDAEDIFDDEQEIKLYRNRFCHRLYRVAATCIARFKSSSISIASIIRSRLAWSFQWAWMNSLRLLHHALKWIGRSVWCGSCWLLHWAWKIFLPRQQSVLPVTSTTIVLTTSVAPSDGPLRVATNAATLDEPVPKTAPMDSWFGSSNCSEGAASDEPVLVTASDAAGDELIIDTTLSDLELISTFNSEGEVSHEPGTALPDSSCWCSSFDFFNSCFWSTCTGIVDAFEVACTYRNWSYDMVGIRNNQVHVHPNSLHIASIDMYTM